MSDYWGDDAQQVCPIPEVFVSVCFSVHVDELAGGRDARVQVLFAFAAFRRVRQGNLEQIQ